jgi:hypothetical protein
LKNGGHFVISIKASCIDSTAPAEVVFAAEVQKMKKEKMKPLEQLTLEPYERDHAVVVGVYRYVSGGLILWHRQAVWLTLLALQTCSQEEVKPF